MSQAAVQDKHRADQVPQIRSAGTARRSTACRRSPVRCSRCSGSRSVCCLLLSFCGSLLISPLTPCRAAADVEVIVEAVDDESPLEIAIVEFEPAFPPAQDRGPVLLKLALQLRIRNRSPAAIPIQQEQFSLLVNGNAVNGAPGSTGAEFRSVTLDPGQEIRGSLCFSEIDCSGGEPALVLKWLRDDQFALVSLNDQLRRLGTFRELRLGANDALLMLSTTRNLDILAVWLLHDLLQRRSRDGILRIVLCPADDSPLLLTDEAAAWLATAAQGSERNPQLPLMLPPAPVRFLEVHVGGFGRGQRRTPLGQSGTAVHRLVDDAVFAAVRSLYRSVDERQAFKDIRQEHPGISRAAIDGCIDRLSPAQVSELLQLARTGPPATQLLVTAHLHRVSGEEVVPALRELSRSEDPRLSATAMQTLTRCTHPAAEAAIRELWESDDDSGDIRSRVVDAVLQTRDFRRSGLLALYTEQLLRSLAAQDSDAQRNDAADGNPSAGESTGRAPRTAQLPTDPVSGNSATPAGVTRSRERPTGQVTVTGHAAELPPDPATPVKPPDTRGLRDTRRLPEHDGLQAGQVAEGEVTRLRAVLEFLKQSQDHSATEAARDTLLQLEPVALQDTVVEFLLQFRDERDLPLIRRCLQQRLQAGTITDTVRTAAAAFPEPAWAPALLADFRQSRNQSASQRKSLSAALRCCSSQHLDQLVLDFDAMDVQSRGLVLSHLAAVQHPAWRGIAQQALENCDPLASDAMDLLSQEGSDRSIRILNEQLLKLIAVDEEQPGGDQAARRSQTARLISKVSLFSHPECRRVLNRCLRHPDEQLRGRAEGAIRASLRRSPGEALLKDVVRLKGEQKFAEALVKANECLTVDEFLPDAYLFRASLWLRDNHLTNALQDLQMADRLCPEEPSTRSTIGLVLVRTGQPDEGLRVADQALSMDPQSNHMLYNTACVYARAAEDSTLPEDRRTGLLHQAVELLQKSAAADFSDVSHLQQDPDLVVLHDHPEWPAIIRRIEQNLEQILKKPGE